MSDGIAEIAEVVAPGMTPPTEADLARYIRVMTAVRDDRAMQAWRDASDRTQQVWGDRAGITPTGISLTPWNDAGERLTTADLHADWLAMDPRPKHPLGPFVTAWFEHPIPEPLDHLDTGPRPLWPAALAVAADGQGRQGVMPLLPHRPADIGQQFPLFTKADHYGGEFLASVLPVPMYATAGRGAPLAIRLLLRGVLDVPVDQRTGPREFNQPWGDVVNEIYPAGNYQPARMLRWLHRAIQVLNADDRFSVFVTGTAEGAEEWLRPVMITRGPVKGHRAERVRFRVELPDGADRGPIADRKAWFLAAAHSAGRFGLATGLAILWDRPGKTRVKPNAKAPFIQSTDARRYPTLTPRELASLAWPGGWPKRLHRRTAEAAAVEHLHALAAEGYCQVERRRGGWRVMPGGAWAGWTDRQRRGLLAE